MRRHFYLILFLFIFISGMSVSYSQDQNVDRANSNEVEKSLDSKSDSTPSETNSDSHQKGDSSIKKTLVNKEEQGEPEKPVNAQTGSFKKAQVEAQNNTTDKKGNDREAATTGDDSANETDQALQKPVRLRNDLFLINRLREVDDEDNKYTRIPEFKKEKKIDQSTLSDVTIDKDLAETEKSVSDSSEENVEKGFFGLSKNTSDLLTKGSLVLFILVIFVLYRLRSKGNSRTVLRRFPKR